MTSKNVESRYVIRQGAVFIRHDLRRTGIGRVEPVPFTDAVGVKFTLWDVISSNGQPIREGMETRAEALHALETHYVSRLSVEERVVWVARCGDIPPLPMRWYEMAPERARELTDRINDRIKETYGDAFAFWDQTEDERDETQELLTEWVLKIVNRQRCSVRWRYSDGDAPVGITWEIEQEHPRTPLDSEEILSGTAVV